MCTIRRTANSAKIGDSWRYLMHLWVKVSIRSCNSNSLAIVVQKLSYTYANKKNYKNSTLNIIFWSRGKLLLAYNFSIALTSKEWINLQTYNSTAELYVEIKIFVENFNTHISQTLYFLELISLEDFPKNCAILQGKA